MIWRIIEILSVFIELWIFMFFADKCIGIKANMRKWRYPWILLVTAIISTLNYFSIFSSYIFLLAILYGLLTAFLMTDGKWYTKIFIVGIYYLLMICIDSGMVFVFSASMQVPMNTILDFGWNRTICIFIAKLVLFIICLIISKFFKPSNHKLPLSYWLMLIVVPMGSIITSILVLANTIEQWQNNEYNMTMFIMLIGYIFISFITIFLFDKSMKDSQIRSDYELLQQASILKDKEMEEAESVHAQMRGRYHDESNHLATILGLLEEGNVDECIDYTKEYMGEVEKARYRINSGNLMVDVLISRKYSVCQKKKIKVDLDCLIPQMLNVHKVDLNVLMGNMIDNAIEACEKIPDPEKRKIEIGIKLHGAYLNILVKNTVKENPFSRSGKLETSKEDKKNHGIGRRNMQSVVNLYDGVLESSCENNIFECFASIKNIERPD